MWGVCEQPLRMLSRLLSPSPVSALGPRSFTVLHQVGDRHICYLPLAHIYERINLVMVGVCGGRRGRRGEGSGNHAASLYQASTSGSTSSL